jgi:hypothetical protein
MKRFFSPSFATIATSMILAGVLALPGPAFAQAAACDGGILDFRDGSSLDVGFRGFAHDMALPSGEGFGFSILHRCSGDDDPCVTDGDCSGEQQCLATCDCVGDTTCEIAGPVGQKRCITDLVECDSNDHCDAGVTCAAMIAPPFPRSIAGVPTCSITHFEQSLDGTIDVATGEVELAANLRSRVHLGIAVDQPCPRCGPDEQDPDVGESFTCEGGTRDGESCQVHAVTDRFGGTSYDCPPSLNSNVSGPGIAIRLDELTTGTAERTAALPCRQFGLRGNPLTPDSNPKCSDQNEAEDPVCASNADCRRCTLDVTVACTSDTDCAEGKGTCEEAPEQPISCGFWCHCGFCGGQASLPCFDDSECFDGLTCDVTVGTGPASNAPQLLPNDCVEDRFVCGTTEDELCATTTVGRCSDSGEDCDPENDECSAGTCVAEPLSCFESRIVREGAASPLGSYCAFGGTACVSNTDCTGESDFCAADVLVPRLAGLYCEPGTASAVLNAVAGVTGPAALTWETRIRMCRCATEDAECEDVCSSLPGCQSRPDGSECSDGDFCTVGDACQDEECVPGPVEDPECEPTTTTTTLPEGPVCGDWNGDGVIMASDAAGVLQVAVGIGSCALSVCDYTGDGSVTVTDALAVLRQAVFIPSDPRCPPAGAT